MGRDIFRVTRLTPLAALVALWIIGSGLSDRPAYGEDPPTELRKVSSPTYRIQPPDIIAIEMAKMVPLPPYRAEVYDVLEIYVAQALIDQPIDNYYLVEAEGVINLGPAYGTVRVVGMTLGEAKKALEQRLEKILHEPKASVKLARVSSMQPVTAQYLVSPDGTINLHQYGLVHVAGLTAAEAKLVLREAPVALPRFAGTVGETNGVQQQGVLHHHARGGHWRQRASFSGDGERDRVGRDQPGERDIAVVERGRVHRPADPWTIWLRAGVADRLEGDHARASTETNYRMMPGDRLFIVQDEAAKPGAPAERFMGFMGRGSTVRNIQTMVPIPAKTTPTPKPRRASGNSPRSLSKLPKRSARVLFRLALGPIRFGLRVETTLERIVADRPQDQADGSDHEKKHAGQDGIADDNPHRRGQIHSGEIDESEEAGHDRPTSGTRIAAAEIAIVPGVGPLRRRRPIAIAPMNISQQTPKTIRSRRDGFLLMHTRLMRLVPLSLWERDGVRGAAERIPHAVPASRFPCGAPGRRRRTENRTVVAASPHPGPLPKGEGDRFHMPHKYLQRASVHFQFAFFNPAETARGNPCSLASAPPAAPLSTARRPPGPTRPCRWRENNDTPPRAARTIGSPRMLKLVLISTGQPVWAANSASNLWNRPCRRASTVCTRAEQSTCVTAGIVERTALSLSKPVASAPASIRTPALTGATKSI